MVSLHSNGMLRHYANIELTFYSVVKPLIQLPTAFGLETCVPYVLLLTQMPQPSLSPGFRVNIKFQCTKIVFI